MKKEIILSQSQMDAIVNASKQNSLETITIQQLCIGGNMYELLFEKRDNGYYYAVNGEGNTFTTELDDKDFEIITNIINNPVI